MVNKVVTAKSETNQIQRNPSVFQIKPATSEKAIFVFHSLPVCADGAYPSTSLSENQVSKNLGLFVMSD